VRAGELKQPDGVQAAIEALEAHLADPEHTHDPAERARLVILLGDLRARLPKKMRRGPSFAAAAVFVLCFVTSAILVWKKVGHAEIDGQVDAAVVRLVPAGQLHSLLDALPVTEVAARGSTTLKRSGPGSGGKQVAKLVCIADCSLHLKGLDLGAVRHLELRRAPGSLRVEAEGKGLSTSVVAEGKIGVEYEDESVEEPSFDPAAGFTIVGDARELQFIVGTQPAESVPLEPLEVSALSFDHDVEVESEGRPVLVQQSSVQKGAVHLRRVNQSKALLRGEHVELAGFTGRIQELVMNPAGFHMAMVGRVRDLRIGEERQSLMPSELETLRADSGLGVYWASAMWLAGLFGSILQWLRSRG
jgi:hypothetical protein